MDWLTENKIPLGKWIKNFVDLLLEHLAWLFDSFSEAVEFLIEGLILAMLWPHPLVLVAIFAGLAYLLHRSLKLVALITLSLLLVINLGYWEETIQTLGLVVFSTIVCIVVGVPLGIAAAHRDWLYTGLRPVLDLMQTIPTFVYLIPTMIMFGLGLVPGLISTVIFAIPAPIRLTHLGVSSVPVALREAGESFGATDRQLLRFGEQMDTIFINQGDQRRSLEQTFDVGWTLLTELPDESLVRLSDEQIATHITVRRDAG